MKKEKQLAIQLLTEKIQKLSGKKVILEETTKKDSKGIYDIGWHDKAEDVARKLEISAKDMETIRLIGEDSNNSDDEMYKKVKKLIGKAKADVYMQWIGAEVSEKVLKESEDNSQELNSEATLLLRLAQTCSSDIVFSDLTVRATDQGNWQVFCNNVPLCKIKGSLLSDETIMKYELQEHGVLEEANTNDGLIKLYEKLDFVGDKIDEWFEENDLVRENSSYGASVANLGYREKEKVSDEDAWNEIKELGREYDKVYDEIENYEREKVTKRKTINETTEENKDFNLDYILKKLVNIPNIYNFKKDKDGDIEFSFTSAGEIKEFVLIYPNENKLKLEYQSTGESEMFDSEDELLSFVKEHLGTMKESLESDRRTLNKQLGSSYNDYRELRIHMDKVLNSLSDKQLMDCSTKDGFWTQEGLVFSQILDSYEKSKTLNSRQKEWIINTLKDDYSYSGDEVEYSWEEFDNCYNSNSDNKTINEATEQESDYNYQPQVEIANDYLKKIGLPIVVNYNLPPAGAFTKKETILLNTKDAGVTSPLFTKLTVEYACAFSNEDENLYVNLTYSYSHPGGGSNGKNVCLKISKDGEIKKESGYVVG